VFDTVAPQSFNRCRISAHGREPVSANTRILSSIEWVSVDSSDPKGAKGSEDSSKSGSGRKLSGGLSAKDLRARLGLKSNTKSSGLQSKLNVKSPPGGVNSGPPEALETSQIEQSVLESLRKDIGLPKKGASSDQPAVVSEPASASTGGGAAGGAGADAGGPKAPSSENSTHALSIDDFEELLVDEGEEPAAAKTSPGGGVPADVVGDLTSALDSAFGDGGESDPHQLATAPQTTPSPAVPVAEQEDVDASGGAVSGSAEIELDESVEIADELEDDGEKTHLLDTSGMFDEEEEDEEFDAFPEEATQIMVPAMDVEPLTGRLVVESGETPQSEYILARDKTGIGRGTNNGIVIPDIAMSRRHLVFERYAEGFVVRDLESGNGTYVNGRRVVYAELRDGDTIEAGNVTFRFEQSGGDPDELWTGEPNIEYHAQDKGASAPKSAPAAPSGAAPAAGGGPQQQAAQQQQPAPGQPQVLLQRQNPMQQQMMMSNPNMPVPGAGGPYGYQGGYTQQGMNPGLQQPQQSGSSPIVTALIVFFSILLLGLLGLIVWSVVEQSDGKQEQTQEESAEEKKQRAVQFVEEGRKYFEARRWDDALNSFEEAKKLDPKNETARIFLEEVIPQARQNERSIRSALKDIQDSPSAGTYDTALLVLKNISPDSVFADEVKNQHLPKVKEAYKTYLLREAKKSLTSGNIIKAKRNLSKIEGDLEMKDDPAAKKLAADIKKAEKEKKQK